MKYKVEDLQIYTTPKAEKIFEFPGFQYVEFEYPGIVRTLLFGDCVRSRGHSGGDYYQVVGRIYKSADPQATDEKHVGKLYVSVYDHPYATRFESMVERLEWYPDGSFDLIEPNGKRTKFHRPQGF
ncbi:MAG: hypothetical protein JOZ02_08085 [Acidobacteria bacterium]|nr:hypothetical protein [Acidobacteriota bacterium]